MPAGIASSKYLDKYSAVFKTKYGEKSDLTYSVSRSDPANARIKKVFDLGGKDLRANQRLSIGGSASFNILPEANTTKNKESVIDAIDAYGRMRIDRRAWNESKTSEMAFENVYDASVEQTTTSFERIQAVSLHNTRKAILGQFGAAATGTAAAPVITLLDTGDYRFRPYVFEEGDYIHIESDVTGTPILEVSKFEIDEINITAKTIKLTRLDGAVDLTNAGFNAKTHNVVFVNSSFYDTQGRTGVSTFKAPVGFLDILQFSTGQTLYGIPFQRRFSPYKLDAGATLINISTLSTAINEMELRTGRPVTSIYCSNRQLLNFVNSQEGRKTYEMSTVNGATSSLNPKVVAGFSAVNIITSGMSPVLPLMSSRFMRDDMVILSCDKEHSKKHLTGFGWFDEDGTILLREQDSDSYEARYGGYYNNMLHPFYLGFITNLSVERI